MNVKKRRFEYIGFVLPLLLAVICLLSVTTNNYQAFLPIPMPPETPRSPLPSEVFSQ